MKVYRPGTKRWIEHGATTNIPGVAKLLDSKSHFSKFEIFREPQLNKYTHTSIYGPDISINKFFFTKTFLFIKNINMYIKHIYFACVANCLKFGK